MNISFEPGIVYYFLSVSVIFLSGSFIFCSGCSKEKTQGVLAENYFLKLLTLSNSWP